MNTSIDAVNDQNSEYNSPKWKYIRAREKADQAQQQQKQARRDVWLAWLGSVTPYQNVTIRKTRGTKPGEQIEFRGQFHWEKDSFGTEKPDLAFYPLTKQGIPSKKAKYLRGLCFRNGVIDCDNWVILRDTAEPLPEPNNPQPPEHEEQEEY